MIGTKLAYIAIVVRNAPAIAQILEHHFALTPTYCQIADTPRQAPLFPIGQTALALFEQGDPYTARAEKTGLHHIAIATDNLPSDTTAAAQAGLPALSPQPQPALNGARRILLDPAATGGTLTYLSDPLPLPPPNPDTEIERIDHLGIASADNAQATAIFTQKLGWPLESAQTDVEISTKTEAFTSDKYGVVYRNHQPELIGGLRVSFITIGDLELEFLQNADPRTLGIIDYGQAGSTRQDQGAISRYIQNRGPGLHHTGLKVKNINPLLTRLAQAGLTLIDPTGRPGGRRSQIAFIHPASLGGWLIHLVERQEIE